MGVENNQFWKVRSRHGTPSIMVDPFTLMEACQEYFEWNAANPITSEKVSFDKDGDVVRAKIEIPRAMTIGGLALFLGVVSETWYDWRKNRPDLKPVIAWAEEIIRKQKFEAAAAGLLNANIIARDLGLADRQIVESAPPKMIIKPPDGEAPPVPEIHGE